MDKEETFYGIPLARLSPYPFTLHLGYDETYGMGICLLLVGDLGCKWRISRSSGIPTEWLLWHRNNSWSRHRLKAGYHLQVGQGRATLKNLEYLIGYARHHEYDEQQQHKWRTQKIGKYAV